MGRTGIPELMVILVVAAIYLIPVAAGVWALGTLRRIRVAQDAMGLRLEAIERLLERASSR